MTRADRAAYVASQVNSSTRLAFKIRKAHTLLDLRDLDASWPTYAQAAGYQIKTEWRVSTMDALLYLFDLLLDAANPPAKPLVEPVFDPDHVRAFLRLTGPVAIKRLIDAGWDQQAALLSSGRQSVLAAQNHVVTESREAMQEAGEEAEDTSGMAVVQGYLRIAKPTACAFCRRLAGATRHIGLVYNRSKEWDRPHLNCRCDIEPQPVYKLRRVRRPEEMALTAEMYAALRRERDDALHEAYRGLRVA